MAAFYQPWLVQDPATGAWRGATDAEYQEMMEEAFVPDDPETDLRSTSRPGANGMASGTGRKGGDQPNPLPCDRRAAHGA